jgi:chemotaxis signal transduction protein
MSAGLKPPVTTFVLLKLGERRFALPADNVEELAASSSLQTFPHTTPLVEGVIVRRGRVIPVRDLARVLVGRTSPLHRFYLIARQRHGSVWEPNAIPVTGDCELLSGMIALPADEGSPAYISGSLDLDGEKISILDLDKFDAMPASRGSAVSETGT